jgi:aspartyl/asparaginyl beta-hydroxylase (cupin superfamily)
MGEIFLLIEKLLKTNFNKILAESINLYKTKQSVDVVRNHRIDSELLAFKDNWITGWTGSDTWINYGIIYANEYNENLFTCLVLKNIETISGKKICMAGLSLLKSGGNIPQHADEANGHEKNVFHFGLMVPPKCYLTVSGVKYREKDGKLLSFNDSLLHSANNSSSKDRLILYFKFA